MKKIITLSLIVFCFVFSEKIMAQGSNCATATPFCSAVGAPFIFPNDHSGTSAQAGPAYGCLCTEPNPSWFYIKASTTGVLTFNISQSTTPGGASNLDVDFVAWGPFTAATFPNACNNLVGSCTGGCSTTANPGCAGGIVDCSYSIASTENMTINAIAGDYYIVMITNFNGAAGYIDFTQTSGASTDCSITCPGVATGIGMGMQDNTGATVAASATLSCSVPYYLISNDPALSSNPGDITAPCISVTYSPALATIPTKENVTVLEGATTAFQFCPAACANGQMYQYGELLYELDSTQSHSFIFCGTAGGAAATTTVSITNCWSGANLVAPQSMNIKSATCYTLTVPAGTDIGYAYYTITPASGASGVVDFHDGYLYVDPNALPSATTFTATYYFKGPDGCAFGQGSFVFTSPTLPNVTVNSPTVCAGSSVNLTAAGANTYSWSTGSTANPLSVSPGATSYTVTGTNTATGCYNTAVATVTVVALPTVTVNSPTVCSGSSVNLTAAGATTYTWNGGSTSNPLSVTPGATSYTVTGTTAGCSNTAVSTVTVVAKPTVTVNSPTVCSGSSVNLTAAGASTYTWNGGSTSNPLSVTPGATSYTVTGTSAAGCTNTAVSTVTVVAKPTVTVNSPTVCAGSSVNLTAAGASTYTWNGGSTSNPLSVTPGATSYTVTGTSGAGCTNTAVSTVTVVALPTVTVNSPTVCSGSSVNLTGAGATTYSWNTGSTSNPLSVTPGATSYTVTGTTAGCSNTAVSTVTVVALPTINVVPTTTAICSGGGSSTLTASGANTYTWTPPATLSSSTGAVVTATPTNTGAATIYTVTGTDANGCVNKNTVSITVNQTPTVTVSGGGGNSQTVCGGGVVNATVNGITFSVTPAGAVTWTNSNTGIGVAANGSGNIASYPAPTVTSQTVGVITASSTVAGCTSTNSTQLNYTITINPIPGETGETISPAGCGMNNGTITGASGTGGSGNYSYQWNGVGGFVVSSSYTNAAGTYPLQIKDNVTGCIYSQNFTIPNAGAPPAPTVTASATSACVGGTVILTAPTVAGVTYNWTEANTNVGTGDSYTVTNMPASPNPYTIGVTATSAGCTSAAATTSITVNPLPTPAISSSTSQICQGSSTTLSVTPTGNYSYQWYNTSGIIVGATSSTLSVTAPDTYSVSVTDNTTNCSASTSANGTITVNPLPTIDTTGVMVTQTSCTVSTGGITNITVTGAATITYTWTTGGALPGGTLVSNGSGTNATISNAGPGVYCLNVTDGNSCQNNFCSITITTAGAPAQPVLTAAGNDTTYCQGDVIQTLTVSVASSGTVTPTINWYSDAGLTTTIATNTNTYTPTGFPVGSTTIYVAATVNGCTGISRPITITINPTPPQPVLTAPTGTNNSFCQGSPVPLTVNSGTTIAVWYSNNTVVNVGSTFNPPANTPAGTYTFSVIDSIPAAQGGCVSASQSANTVTLTLVVNPTPPAPTFTGTTTSNNAYCEGSPVPLTVNSGTTIAVWYSNNTVVNVGSTYTPPANLPAGTYTFSVIDSIPAAQGGCTSASQSANTFTLTLVVNPIPPTPTFTGTTTANNSYCEGSPVPLTVNSGTTIAVWYSNNTVVNVGSTYTPPANLPAGTYTFSVIDSIPAAQGGCVSASQSANTFTLTLVVNPTPPAPVLTAPTGTSNSFCQGSPVPLTVNSGTTTAVWYSNNTVVNVGSTFNPPANTPAGTYTFSVIDSIAVAGGCVNAPQSANTVTLTLVVNPTPPTPTFTGTTTSSNAFCQGSPVPLTVNSGTTIAVWYSNNTVVNVGSTFNPPASTPAGTYTFSVIDSIPAAQGGCVSASQSANTFTLTLVVNPTPTVNVSTASVDSANCGQSTGGVTGINNNNVSGGTLPYSYQWTNVSTGGVVSTDSTLSNQGLGTYNLQVTDANGCVANVTGGSSTFTVPASIAVQAQAITNPNPATGTIPLAVSFTNTSVGATSYAWSFGDGNTSIAVNPTNTYTNVGTYTVTLIAANGPCTNTFTVLVVANIPTTLIIPTIFTPNGDGVNDEFYIPNTGMSTLTCDIFNRWGQLLHTITAPNQGWDGITPNGDKAPDGTYLYMLQAQGLDGKTYKQQGTVTLVR